MKKKIFIYISLFCLVFTFVYVQPSKHYEAAILSKVASAGAKKVVKEVIKDMSVEMATNYALNEAFRIASEAEAKYKVDENYKVICSVAVNGSTCDKPVQVKTALTEADKISVGHQAEIELEKLITNGKGFSRWQKFMDWFLPIWLVSLTVTALTYALDPEVRSLFNEAGYNALVALGLIKKVTTTDTQSIATIELPEVTEQTQLEQTTYKANFNSGVYNKINNTIPNVDLMMETKFATAETNAESFYFRTNHCCDESYIAFHTKLTTSTLILGNTNYKFDSTNIVDATVTYAIDGTVIATRNVKNHYTAWSEFAIPSTVNIEIKKANAIRWRTAYEVNGFYYTDVLFDTVDGKDITIQIKSTAKPSFDSLNQIIFDWEYPSALSVEPTTIVYKNISPYVNVLTPNFDDIATNEFPKSTYENGSGQVSIIPPTAIPHKQTSTGTTLTPVIDETTGDKKYITPVGDEVPEEDITVEDPIIEKTPEGTTYTPPATETNPNPEPVPLTPPEPTPGGEEPPTDPPTDEEPPPEGGSKKPNVPIALLLGLFKLLIAIIYYLIRLFTFIVTIQFIEPTVIDNPTFQWFKTATVLGIQPYPLVINMAIFFLSFSIYKSIRRVFG